jgi:hypothetical protein
MRWWERVMDDVAWYRRHEYFKKYHLGADRMYVRGLCFRLSTTSVSKTYPVSKIY